ncbi:MAG: glycoside hydrolase family 2 [Blastocatellia bacterium]|nr:MAG: glycoside hydrolase family 2 [Blastocatellia bacterium]
MHELPTHAQNESSITPRSTVLFDSNWRFHRGGAQGAESADFDDSKWRELDLPHDWSIEDLPGTNSPFDPNAISQVNGGFTTGGTGWYRKAFTISNAQDGKRIVVQFDGVYMNAEIWLNGQWVGTHPYGYTSFWFDLTDKVKRNAANVLAVKVRNEGENSRWYSGSGIYRHVWLKTLDPTHIAQWGTYITSSKVNQSSASLKIKTAVTNQRDSSSSIRLLTRIVDIKGREVARVESNQTIDPHGVYEFNQETTVASPMLWSPDSPTLYTAITEVRRDRDHVDSVETKFGIRTISFDTTNGFILNGKPLKLKGGCLHHDNGPLGARAFDRAEERRVELLKASGYNALRLAHNPPSPAFLDACDRLGMMVIDEAFDMWREGKNPHDYHLFFDEWWKRDIDSMIARDRNHPSVIMWSIGNEIPSRQKPEVVKVAKELADHVRELEPTRPITSAVNDLREDKDPYFATLDVGGYNYAAFGDRTKSLYEFDHKRVPNRVMFGSESYPLEAFDAWMNVVDHPYVIGDFVWTAFDYLGEASIGWRGYFQEQSFYPWNIAYCGDIDTCGWKRPQSYYRDALWKPDQLSVFVTPPQPSFPPNPKRQFWSKWHWFDVVANWNWAGYERKPLNVTVYSSCDEVELFLNGKSLGKKPTNRATEFKNAWSVPYEPGLIKAIGYRAAKQVNSSELRTASQPTHLALSADRTNIRADNQDLSYVTVQLIDESGVRNPMADNLVNFSLTGPGEIIAVANGNPMSTESYQQSHRKAWQGRLLVVVRSTKEPGKITLTATADSLRSASAVITSQTP